MCSTRVDHRSDPADRHSGFRTEQWPGGRRAQHRCMDWIETQSPTHSNVQTVKTLTRARENKDFPSFHLHRNHECQPHDGILAAARLSHGPELRLKELGSFYLGGMTNTERNALKDTPKKQRRIEIILRSSQ